MEGTAFFIHAALYGGLISSTYAYMTLLNGLSYGEDVALAVGAVLAWRAGRGSTGGDEDDSGTG
jgi:hypothetical protein